MSNQKRATSKIASKIQEALDNLDDFEVQAIKVKYSEKTWNPLKKRSNNKKMFAEVEILLNKREIERKRREAERKREQLRLENEKRREMFYNNVANFKAHVVNHYRLYIAAVLAVLALFSGFSIFSKIQSTVKNINFVFSDEQKYIGDYIDVSYFVEPETAKYEESDVSIIFNNDNLINFNEEDNKYICAKEGELIVKLFYKGKEFDSKTIKISPILISKLYLPDITIGIGNTMAIKPVIEPSNATNKNYTMSVDDTSIASIKDNKLIGISSGTTVLHLEADDGFKYDVNVDVVDIEPTSISINGLRDNYEVGETGKISIKYTPEETTLKDIIWTSSNNNVLSIDQEGNITAKEKGKAVITAHYNDTVESKKEITVDYPMPESIEITNKSNSLTVGYSTQLYATITPKKVSDNSINWSSSDSNIATVNKNGVLKGKSEGTVTIWAETANGRKDFIDFTIKKASIGSTSKSTSNASSSGGGSGVMVWIPKTGSKFHTISTCSNMKNPTQVTIEQAREWNYQPCSKCAKGY